MHRNLLENWGIPFPIHGFIQGLRSPLKTPLPLDPPPPPLASSPTWAEFFERDMAVPHNYRSKSDYVGTKQDFIQ